MCHRRNVRVYHLTARLAQHNIVHADTKAPFNLKRVKSERICSISFQSAHPLNNLLKFIPQNSVASLCVTTKPEAAGSHQAASLGFRSQPLHLVLGIKKAMLH